MSHFFVTTEVSEQTVPIVIFDELNIASESLQSGFAEYPTTVTFFETLPESEAQYIQLDQAYRIVCLVHPLFFSQTQQLLLEKIKKYQDKIILVVPVFSHFSQEVQGEIPNVEEAFAQQTACIDFCNTLLPRATFIFVRDVLLSPGAGTLFDYLLQHLDKHFAFIPITSCTVLTSESAFQCVVREVLRPERSSSCIQGQKRNVDGVIRKITEYYNQYYTFQTSFQIVRVHEQPTIPFTVRSIVIRERIEDVCLKYSQLLPAPTQLPFSLPIIEPLVKEYESSQEVVISEPEYSQVVSYEANTSVEVESIEKTIDQTIEIAPPVEEFNLQGEITKIFTTQRVEQKRERLTEVVHTEKKIAVKKKKKALLFYGGMIFTFVGIVVGILSCIFIASKIFLQTTVSEFIMTSFSQEAVSPALKKKVQFFSDLVQWQKNVYGVFVELPIIEEASSLVQLPSKITHTLALQAQSQQQTTRLIQSILGSGELPQVSAEIEAIQSLPVAQNNEELLSSMQQVGIAGNALAVAEKKMGVAAATDVNKNSEKIASFLLSSLPDLVGEKNKKTYALLFQNNQELRPTGGFIEAVALLTFEKGTLITKKIYSSYELDKLMPGEILAPQDVTQYTGEKRMTFFETNWEPDFPTSAEKIRFYIEKSVGVSVDGVLALDLYGIQNVLQITGPLDIPEYNEVVTSKNIFERVEAHSEVVLVANTQQREYRTLLLEKFLQKITSLPDEKTLPFINSMVESLSTRSLQISVSDGTLQSSLTNMGWSGSILTPACPSEFSAPCTVDTFMAVETNVGVNKANAYITRTSAHSIELQKNAAVHTHTLSLENTSTSGAWPKGTYKAYVRAYIPLTARAVSVMVDTTPIPFSTLGITQQYNKKVVGFLTEVPITSKKKITISYTVDLQSPIDAPKSYVFVYQKQAGIPQDSATVEMKLESTLSPTIITPPSEVQGQRYIFTPQLKPVEVYGFQFQ